MAARRSSRSLARADKLDARARIQLRIAELQALRAQQLKARKALVARARAWCAKQSAECKARRAKAAAHKRDEQTALERQIRELRIERRERHRLTTPAESRAAGIRRDEAEERVRRDIEPELLPVYDAVQRHLPRRPRASKAEVFSEWVHEHPESVTRILGELADREMQAVEEQLSMLSRLLGQAKPITDAQLRAAGIDPGECDRAGFDCATPSGLERYVAVSRGQPDPIPDADDLRANLLAVAYELGQRQKVRVRLANLKRHPDLWMWSPDEIDAELVQMQRAELLVLYRDDHTSALTQADRDAALYVGDSPRHIIYLL